MDEGHIWVWSTIQTVRKENASNMQDFKKKVRLLAWGCENA